jgi:hypothetical protein
MYKLWNYKIIKQRREKEKAKKEKNKIYGNI